MFSRFHQILLFSVLSVLSTTTLGQTLVSTSPENKRAVLEEFGGMYCVYCPQGHQVLNELSTDLNESLVLLNYHAGFYAVPLNADADLRSNFGEEILYQTNLSGFPAATVNRQVFPGYEQGLPGSTALGRANWPVAIAEVLQAPSPVNIAAAATLNIATRALTVTVEYYYTADVEAPSNKLNVAILQNNVLAPQHGGGQGSHYPHQHLVRDFLTGQWGHTIATTTMGTFGSLTYEYTLPIDYRGVPVDLFNIEIAAFIAENEQHIYTGTQVTPTLMSSFDVDADLVTIYAADDVCTSELSPEIIIRNDGSQALESVDIVYTIDGAMTETYTWEGHLESLEETNIQLPSFYAPEMAGTYLLEISLQNPNGTIDPTVFNNVRNQYFTVAPRVDTYHLELAIRTDDFGYELYWEVVDEFGDIFAYGGNLAVGETDGGAQIATPNNPGAYPDDAFIIEDIELPFEGCYRLRVLDDFADGLCCEYGNGYYKLRAANTTAILEGSSFGAIDEQLFMVALPVVSAQTIQDKAIQIFPNPAKIGQAIHASIPENERYQWELFNLNGQLLRQGTQSDLIQTNHLFAGYYMLCLKTEKAKETFPLILQP